MLFEGALGRRRKRTPQESQRWYSGTNNAGVHEDGAADVSKESGVVAVGAVWGRSETHRHASRGLNADFSEGLQIPSLRTNYVIPKLDGRGFPVERDHPSLNSDIDTSRVCCFHPLRRCNRSFPQQEGSLDKRIL